MTHFKFPKLEWKSDDNEGAYCDTPTGKRIVVQYYSDGDWWCGDAGDSYGCIRGQKEGYNTLQKVKEAREKDYWDSQRVKYERCMEYIRKMHTWLEQ